MSSDRNVEGGSKGGNELSLRTNTLVFPELNIFALPKSGVGVLCVSVEY